MKNQIRDALAVQYEFLQLHVKRQDTEGFHCIEKVRKN